jgi:hypothetical protein
MAAFWFNFNCGSSGQAYFTEGVLQMYNLFYTSLPILYYASYDLMLSSNTFYRFPQTYRACVHGKFFSTQVFWMWVFHAIFESVVFSVLPLYLLMGMDAQTGNLDTFWEAGIMSVNTIVIVVNLKMFMIQTRFHWSNVLCLLYGPLSWIASIYWISERMWFDFNFYDMFLRVFSSYMFWAGMAMILTLAIGKDLYVYSVEHHFNFQPHHIVQEADALMLDRVARNKKKGRVADSTPVKLAKDPPFEDVDGPEKDREEMLAEKAHAMESGGRSLDLPKPGGEEGDEVQLLDENAVVEGKGDDDDDDNASVRSYQHARGASKLNSRGSFTTPAKSPGGSKPKVTVVTS